MPSQQTSLLSVRGSWRVVVTLLPTMHPVFSLPPPLLPSLSSTRRLWSLGPGRSRWKIGYCGSLATLPTTSAPPCTLVSMSPRLRSSVGFSASLWSSASAVPCRTMALGLLPKLLLLICLPAWLTALPSRYVSASSRCSVPWCPEPCSVEAPASYPLSWQASPGTPGCGSSLAPTWASLWWNPISSRQTVWCPCLSLLHCNSGSLTCSRPGIGPSWLPLAAAVLWLVSVILWKFEARTPAQTGAPWTGRPDLSKWSAGTCDDRGESVSQSRRPSGLSCKTSRPVRSC